MSNSIKKKSLELYKNWQKHKCYCPALKENIIFSSQGWNHIVGNKGSKKRSWNDVYRRLKLLPFAKEIICESTTIQNVETRNNTTYFVLEAMKLLTVNKKVQWCKVRVIIVEDKIHRKIFLSVMDKKSPQF
jgi:hypothetical protein